MWRNANKNIVKFWYDLERACIRIMQGETQVEKVRCLTIRREVNIDTSQDFLTIELPVGRKLYYARPSLQLNRFDKPALHYWAVNVGKWSEIETYGGKLTENVVQAIARDCLCDCLLKLEKMGIDILFHVHDEIICEVPYDRGFGVKELEELMGEPFCWAPGLKLTAAGLEAPFYIKD
jgi:DNA polymerase